MRRTFQRGLDLVGRETWGRWVLLVVLALTVSGFEVAGAVIVLLMMSLVTGAEELEIPLLGDVDALLPTLDPQEQLLAVSAAIAVFFIVRVVLMVAQDYLQGRIAHNAGSRLSARLMGGYLSLPYEYHLRRNSSELIRNTYDTVQVFVREVLLPSTRVISEFLVVIGIVGVLLVTSPVATLLAVGVLGPLTFGLLRVVHPAVERLGIESQRLSQTSLQTLQQSLGGSREIKVLGRETPFRREYARQRQAFARAQYIRSAFKHLPGYLTETMMMLFIVGFFAVTVAVGGSTNDTLSILGLFAYSALRLKAPLASILGGLNSVKFAAAAIDDLYADLVMLDRVASSSPDRRRPPARLAFEQELRFEGVTFRYDDEGPEVLKDVDLVIRRGESVGVVGPTGGGKSTLVDVLMGLLTPSAGRVTVDGVDVSGREADWQANLGVVSQRVFLIDDTLRRNICLGLEDSEIDDAALDDAVRKAQLHGFVRGLPRGLDTVVGEAGVRVSGGQRQRIAIARALYHRPSVLVFDEGTSALDTLTEREIVGALENLRGERTIITVAHRLSTIRSCDKILLIEANRPIAVGSYEELIQHSAAFRAMAEAA